MSNYEKDIKELIERMNQQNSMMPQNMNFPQRPGQQGPGGILDGGTDQSPHLMNERHNNMMSPDQSPLNPVNSVRPMGTPVDKKVQVNNLANITTTAPVAPAVEGGCPHCGMIHPPIAQGAKCPMAPVKVKNGEEEKVIDVNKFLANLKNIILSQAEQKGIKDIEKLFKNIIVNVTQFIEEYNG